MSLILNVLLKSHKHLVFGIPQKVVGEGKSSLESPISQRMCSECSVRMWERRWGAEYPMRARYNAAFCGVQSDLGSGMVRCHRGGECSSVAHRVGIALLNPWGRKHEDYSI